MRIYNRYIAILAVLFMLTTVILSTTHAGLDVYFSLYLIECLTVSLLFSHLNARARKDLGRVSAVLFAGFLALVAIKVVEIISGTSIL